MMGTIRVIFKGETVAEDLGFVVQNEPLFMDFALQLLERLETELNKDGKKGMSWPEDETAKSRRWKRAQ
jgi:hypothetical protein